MTVIVSQEEDMVHITKASKEQFYHDTHLLA